ncbi:hypothetical protein [Hyphococcus sp.]|uniref:hypothetical protein n=1 Tax=Hyphococcus sp. TaxID=2038636 RepID=UPI002089E646|nr:MAG: hypothetical protein DHS20C04_16540 [Marinicaulis sp.]
MKTTFLILLGLVASFGSGAAFAQEGGGYVHENGIGPDPDRDTNPATITGVIKRIGDPADEGDTGPYRVIDFETPPGKHGDVIREAYANKYGVHFGRGLKRQVCEGQRRFYYDSICTYEAAPSGKYAAGYLNYLNAPLVIEFDKPVCVVTMAAYPTGGANREPFTLTIEGWDAQGYRLPEAEASFNWSKNTVRWRNMAGAYYIGGRAKKIAVSMKSGSPSEAGEVLRFLIDDLAFVQEGCEEVLSGFVEEPIDLDDPLDPTDEVDEDFDIFEDLTETDLVEGS